MTGNFNNKMKYKKYHTVGKVPKSNKKFVERGRIDIPNTQQHGLITVFR